MTKKILAMILSMALCLSFAACGDKDDDDSSKKSKNESSAAAADDDSEGGDAKDDDSKADDKKDDESKADDKKDDESKADDKKDDESKADESKADESKVDDFVPEGEGEWVEGTGYKVFLGENWVNFEQYKAELEAQIEQLSKDQFNIDSAVNMEVCFYYDDGDFTDGAPNFNIAKPTKNSAFKLVTLKDLESQLNAQLEAQFNAIKGASISAKGLTTLGGVDALEYEASVTMNGISLRSRQFVVLNGEYMYNVTFSIPADQFDGLKNEMDTILKSLKFTGV